MLTTRERFHAVMAGRPVDRLPVIEWANWWSQTIARWHTEGLPTELTDRYDIVRHFGLDLYKQAWLRSVSPDAPQPTSHGAGIIQTESDYDRLQPFLFQLRDEWPVNPTQWRQWAEEQKRGEAVLWFTVDGFFWLPRVLLGIERHLYAFYDQPELMHRINAENARWMIRLIDRLCESCVPDFMTFAEDLSYNHGPMLSAELFEEFLAPYYRQVIPHLRARGIIPIVDSDGDVSQVASWFEGVGVAGILPLERQAGVDVVALRQKHPALNWIGAFDKLVLHQGEAAIRAEFERLLPATRGGHLLISCDHQTPPGVSYQDYQFYLRLFHEYAVKAACQ